MFIDTDAGSFPVYYTLLFAFFPLVRIYGTSTIFIGITIAGIVYAIGVLLKWHCPKKYIRAVGHKQDDIFIKKNENNNADIKSFHLS